MRLSNKTFLSVLLILLPMQLFAQLTNIKDKTGAQVGGVVEGVTVPNKAFFDARSGLIVNLSNAILNRTYNVQDYASLSAALTDAKTDSASLLITSTLSITSDTTIGGNTELIIGNNGRFNIGTSGDTLTISVPFSAGLHTVFTGSGSVQFTSGSVKEVFPKWWGSNAAAVNSAIQSLPSTGGVITLTQSITITDSILIDKAGVIFQGRGFSSAQTGAGSVIITKDGSFSGIVITKDGVTVRDIIINGAVSNTGDGISIQGSRCVLRNVTANDHGDNGIRIGRGSANNNLWRMYNVVALSNDSSGIYIHDDGGGLADTNAGVAFGLDLRSNGNAGLKIDNSLDNQFYGLHAASNTGYGIDLFSNSSDGHWFFAPYLESNSAGTGIIRGTTASDNFVFGVRQAIDDGWTDNGDDNVILGRSQSVNDMFQFQGAVAFDSLHISAARTTTSGSWAFWKEVATRTLKIELVGTVGNSGVEIGHSGSGTVNLELPDGGLIISEAAGTVVFSGATSATISTSASNMNLALTPQGSGVVDVNGGLISENYNFAADGQADDDYEVTIPEITALTTGLMVTFTATTANTGAATLEITSVGDLDTILKRNNLALATGDIEAGQVVVVVFDGSGNWQMISQLAQ